MAHIIAESTFEFPFTADEARQAAQEIDRALQESGSFWLRSYYSQDRRRMICEFESPDTDAVKHAYVAAAFPLDRAWPAEVFAGSSAKAD